MDMGMNTRWNQVVGVRLCAWLICVGSLAGCMHSSGKSSSSTMHPSAQVPSATGKVSAKRSEGNMELSVKVDHMAPPEKIARGATTYVVWAEPAAGGAPQNLGSLKVGEDRSAKLDTTTPSRDMKIIVTPETSPDVTKPSNDPVLWTTINQ
jgi:hypothetical protein